MPETDPDLGDDLDSLDGKPDFLRRVGELLDAPAEAALAERLDVYCIVINGKEINAGEAHRALLAERDGMHVDLNRAYAERKALEDRCVALRDERDALAVAHAEAARLAADKADGLGEMRAQRDALLAVVRAARDVGVFDKATMRLAVALDALPPELREMVDQS